MPFNRFRVRGRDLRDEARTILSLPIDKRRKKMLRVGDCLLTPRRSFLKVSILFRYGDREIRWKKVTVLPSVCASVKTENFKNVFAKTIIAIGVWRRYSLRFSGMFRVVYSNRIVYFCHLRQTKLKNIFFHTRSLKCETRCEFTKICKRPTQIEWNFQSFNKTPQAVHTRESRLNSQNRIHSAHMFRLQ